MLTRYLDTEYFALETFPRLVEEVVFSAVGARTDNISLYSAKTFFAQMINDEYNGIIISSNIRDNGDQYRNKEQRPLQMRSTDKITVSINYIPPTQYRIL